MKIRFQQKWSCVCEAFSAVFVQNVTGVLPAIACKILVDSEVCQCSEENKANVFPESSIELMFLRW